MAADIAGEVQAWINSVGTVVIAAGVIYNAWRTRQLEKNTNSIKDALVTSTAKASHLEGREEVRAEIGQSLRTASAAIEAAAPVVAIEAAALPAKPL